MRRKVYCDRCERFALAKVDGTPYCTRCLISTLGRPPRGVLIMKIRPLEVGKLDHKKEHRRG